MQGTLAVLAGCLSRRETTSLLLFKFLVYLALSQYLAKVK